MRIKTVEIGLKHNDCANMVLRDEDGNTIEEKQGYMPTVGIFGGDYTELSIDNDTGVIQNWKPIVTLKTKDDEEEEENNEDVA